jgi:hypothetical protein
MAPPKTQKAGRSALADVVAREYTIHLHKRVFGASFKKRAPLAIKEIKAFAKTAMVRYSPSVRSSNSVFASRPRSSVVPDVGYSFQSYSTEMMREGGRGKRKLRKLLGCGLGGMQELG